MPRSVSLGVVGDRDPENQEHLATERAFRELERGDGLSIEVEWLPTERLAEDGALLGEYRALVIAPGSPYRSAAGALRAIRWARENRVPILGTCGGFQHMIVEYARNVLGIYDAEHEEEHPEGPNLFVTRLSCSLVGRQETVEILPGTRARAIFEAARSEERFFCNFGLNPARRREIEQGGFRVSGIDRNGEVRIMEIEQHPFFLGTLFVPQVSSSFERPHPLVAGLLRAAVA